MTERTVLIPDAEHPIEVTPQTRRVRVYAGDRLVADTTSALTLTEQGYPPAQYVPRADVEETLVRPSDTTTYCPYKGEASYLSVVAEDGAVEDAGWFYSPAHDAVGSISDHVAWNTDRVRVDLG